MVKLSRLGLRRKPWSLIRDSYKHYQCAALIVGQPGTWFIPERGIHQGAPLSMPLYQVYINDLLTQLRDSPFGAMIGEIYVTCPATADDIAICALYKHGLNELLQIAYDYSKQWFFEFSPEKCLVMVWGRDRVRIWMFIWETRCCHLWMNISTWGLSSRMSSHYGRGRYMKE